MTYLEIVNKVLRRLRENEVYTVDATPYSKLIGDFVNTVKREVEDRWNWSALRTTLTANTTANLFNYVLIGSTTRIKILDMFNDTDNIVIQQRSTKWFDIQFLLTNPETGSPYYYNFNGVDSNGDTQVDFYPIPDGRYDIRVNCIIPQAPLENDDDRILVPGDIIVEGVLARAISERGDDGGFQEQELRYKEILGDYIAIESAQRMDEVSWSPY